VQAAWLRWRTSTVILHDKKTPLKLTSAVYEVIVRPALTCASECWAIKAKTKRKIATKGMKMLRGILGVSRLEHTRK